MRANWTAAASLGACASIGFATLVYRRNFPPLLGFLVTLAALVNTAGYVFTLWHERTPFDEMVHAFTTFAGVAAIGWQMLRKGIAHNIRFLWSIVGIGLFAGLAWEAFEFAIGMIGDSKDTLVDLLMDGLGALGAGVLLQWLADGDTLGNEYPPV